MFAALAIAQVAFDGTQRSEVAGNLAFFGLLASFPAGFIALPLSLELLPSPAWSSRLSLTILWIPYFVLGLIQWLAVLWLIRHMRSNKALQSDGSRPAGETRR
jgi:multisubunit Na+/H+ antiporter MnhE subunit